MSGRFASGFREGILVGEITLEVPVETIDLTAHYGAPIPDSHTKEVMDLNKVELVDYDIALILQDQDGGEEMVNNYDPPQAVLDILLERYAGEVLK
jgi:hypothetical protein